MNTRKGYLITETAFDYNDEHNFASGGVNIHPTVYLQRLAADAAALEINKRFAAEVAANPREWGYGERVSSFLDGLSDEDQAEFKARVLKGSDTDIEDLREFENLTDEDLTWLTTHMAEFRTAVVEEVDVEE